MGRVKRQGKYAASRSGQWPLDDSLQKNEDLTSVWQCKGLNSALVSLESVNTLMTFIENKTKSLLLDNQNGVG